MERKSTSTNECCYFTLQNETLSKPLHNNTKKGQNSTKKARNLLVHIVDKRNLFLKGLLKVTEYCLTDMFWIVFTLEGICSVVLQV